ncbi:predicted protein [Naegleria gruberi]|uniref:Predicted protein n=1 Tax=Naegleria gruberi TaxID=5762 RepID=D2W156_NAEGR|nr:uncharacterized protein NAEGRDRAFT_75096 [Naegleria gruberi]EFC37172.1 predicted protein [Naegleria gruberi]|eukprot:XP_002669916.1 predicted protein [Naegleria gruberi strain NEG-M]
MSQQQPSTPNNNNRELITTPTGEVISVATPLELYFSQNFMGNEPMYRVFELPDDFDIDGYLESVGGSSDIMQDEDEILKIEQDLDSLPTAFYIKGENNSPAFLCTDSNSFEITRVDTSNTVLILDPSSGEIHGRVSCTYEITPSVVKLKEDIEKILPYYPKNGISESETITGNVKFRSENKKEALTLEELESCIKASRNEILNCLTYECHAICNDRTNRWYLLDQKLFFQIYELLLLMLAETSFSTKLALDRENVKKELGGEYDHLLLEHCLDLLSSQPSFNSTVELDINKICIFNAISLFNTHNKWRLKDFQNTWDESMNSFQQALNYRNPDISLLISQGYCVLVEEEKNLSKENTMIHFLDRRDLPSQYKERLTRMFKCKPKWTFNEILIYFSELMLSKSENALHQELETLLKKHCKIQQSVLKKEKFYLMK